MTEEEKKQLAAEVKAWRGATPQVAAARILGVSPRTLEGIEQGRGFNYPDLLRHAMKTMEAGHGNAS